MIFLSLYYFEMELFKEKIFTVDTDTYKQLLNQLGKRFNRVTENDIDKDFEKKLCEIAFGKPATAALPDQDIKEDVDCIVDNYKVQVKCRNNSHLFLEDYKTRVGVDKKVWKSGWLDRSLADLFLFVYPKAQLNIACRYYLKDSLKELLQLLRNSNLKNGSIRTRWGELNFSYKPEILKKDGDGLGAYYEIFL